MVQKEKRENKKWLVLLALLLLLFGFGFALYDLFFQFISTFWSLIFEFFYFFFLLPLLLLLLLLNRKNLDPDPSTSLKFAWPLIASTALVTLFYIKADTTLLNNFPPKSSKPAISLPINQEKPDQSGGDNEDNNQKGNQEDNQDKDQAGLLDFFPEIWPEISEWFVKFNPLDKSSSGTGDQSGDSPSDDDENGGLFGSINKPNSNCEERLQKSIRTIYDCLFPDSDSNYEPNQGCVVLRERVGDYYKWQMVWQIKYRYLDGFDHYDIYLLSERKPDAYYLCQGKAKCAILKDYSLRIRVNSKFAILDSELAGYSKKACTYNQRLAGEDQAQAISSDCWNYQYQSAYASNYTGRFNKPISDSKIGCYPAYPNVNENANNQEPEHAPY